MLIGGGGGAGLLKSPCATLILDFFQLKSPGTLKFKDLKNVFFLCVMFCF